MESWSYFSGGKGFVSEESVSVNDGMGRVKNGVMGWELKTQSSYGMCTTDNQGFHELGSPNLMRKPMFTDQMRDGFASSKHWGGGGGSIVGAFSGEDKSSSKLSSSAVDSISRDSSLIDLKLGRFPDHHVDGNIFKSAKTLSSSTSAESILPAKRMRAGGLNSHKPFCQVQGCGKDLSPCKDYHKRHKVCEVHSKTAKVIVNGIEQRFCQQCSRFHLLAEFDDGKRSCRKRLAGHNERRRKPPHTGTRFRGTSFATSPFACQDILSSRYLHQPKYEMSDWCKNVKVEDGVDYSPQLAMPFTNGQLQPKSHFTSYHAKKGCHSFHDGLPAVTTSRINESTNSSLHDMRGSDFVSPSLFHTTSTGSEVLHALDTSSIQGLSGISNSSNALSLLSSQSQGSSNHSTVFSTSRPLIQPNNNYNVTQASKNVLGLGPQASAGRMSNTFNSSGINSAEGGLDQMIFPNNTCGINRVIQGSDLVNSKNQLSCEDGPTIDLLQLSSQLQRVEHQRFSVQVKQDGNAFPGLRIT